MMTSRVRALVLVISFFFLAWTLYARVYQLAAMVMGFMGYLTWSVGPPGHEGRLQDRPEENGPDRRGH